MWSLPDIHTLNARASDNAAKLRREARRKRKPKCECYNCSTQATESFLVYDIFSDDPKSVIHLCEHHVGFSGDPLEGYFTCDDCQRVMVENYTWEYYRVDLDGACVCLSCAAEGYFADQDNWIDPAVVREVVLQPRDPHLLRDGRLNIAKCKHVLGVKQPIPAGIEFVENAEFDSCDGRQISGRRVLEIIKDLTAPFCPVLDAAYQFAISIGIYVRATPIQEPTRQNRGPNRLKYHEPALQDRPR